MLTVEEIKKRISEIAALASDPEAAHGNEDELYADTLKAIADGADNAAELAAAALKCLDLTLDRWYA